MKINGGEWGLVVYEEYRTNPIPDMDLVTHPPLLLF